MQEVLAKSVPHLPRFDSPEALLVQPYKVAKNRGLMSRRGSKFAPKEELSLDELARSAGTGSAQRRWQHQPGNVCHSK